MQLGFVIDHTRCIGCHACTVACKSENDVPLGDFRTWVKYTEQGEWPTVERSFAVLRCNQCTDAPCVTICPVTALDKRPDGIVDVDPRVCIGCKACMQGCPYDALYLNEEKGVAEKCHFCAHRVEQGLAPACAVVCPTEAIVPGDFHDPQSAVSRLNEAHDLQARKTEAGTGPNVLYREVGEAGIQPLLTQGGEGYLWADRRPGPQLDAQVFEAFDRRARGEAHGARTTYGVDRQPMWGGAITGYLFFKSLAAGLFLAGMGYLAPAVDAPAATAGWLVPLVALLALGVTLALLVVDLKRPERFLSILLRPNWDSWLAKGSFVLMGYSVALTGWLALGLGGVSLTGAGGWALVLVTGLLACLSAMYTAWLFAQAKGRVLWMRRGFALQLLAQAVLAGGAAATLAEALGAGAVLGAAAHDVSHLFLLGLLVHGALVLLEGHLAPAGREEEYERAARLVTRGPFARAHWRGGVALGLVVPLVLLVLGDGGWMHAVAGVCALCGLWIEEDVTVRAGQALPIS